MICVYCGNPDLENTATKCSKCGGPVEIKQKTEERLIPFFYEGYMIWPARDYCYDQITMYFWLGDRLVDTITLSRMALEELVPVGNDPFQLFWELFKVSQGETEVLCIKELNSKYPATFEIRRIENSERKFWSSISREELHEMFKRDQV
jgi:hypothetical protein